MRKIFFILLTLILVCFLSYIIFIEKQSSTTISILGEDTATMSAIEDIKDKFEIENNVEINIVKNTFEVLQQKAGQDLANGTGLYDIILNYNFSLSSYTKNRWVLTKDEYTKFFDQASILEIEKNVFPNIWKETGYFKVTDNTELEAVGYPFAGNTMLLVYNKKYFENEKYKQQYKKKYGEELLPPKTWEQFRNIAEYFTDLTPNLKGVVLQGASGGWLYYEICNFLYSMGEGIMDKNFGWDGDINTPLLLNTPNNVKALNYYLSLKPFNAGDYFSTGQNEQVEIMRSQNAVLAIMWSDVLFNLINSNEENSFGFSTIPGDASVIGGGIYYINRASKNIEIAAKFIEYLVTKESQILLMKKGLCSAFQNVYKNEEIMKIPYSTALFNSLKRGKYMHEAGPDADAVQEIVTTMVQSIWRGEISIQEAVTKAQNNLKKKRDQIFELTNSTSSP